MTLRSQPSRREFLQKSLATSALLPCLSLQGLARASVTRDRALLIVDLVGGNDGLNTVIPYADDRYRSARPTLGIAANDVLKLSDEQGLHPSLTGLRDLFHQGWVTVVQNVGYPDPDRSHFRSMDIWATARLQPHSSTPGWLGRWVDDSGGSALALGAVQAPRALHSERSVSPVLRSLESLKLSFGADGAETSRRACLEELSQPGRSSEGEELTWIRQVSSRSMQLVDRVAEVAQQNGGDQPLTLARTLRGVAHCIQQSLPFSVYCVRQDGYDTHARQAASHAQLLAELDGALREFFTELGKTGKAEQVAVLVCSEFGRRVRENGSLGTDHGAAAPSLVVSPASCGGILGPSPDLGALDQGDVPYKIDFRQVYAALLRDWLRVPRDQVAALVGVELPPLHLFARSV
jgi:uncharacterized protein (DUF1501 family)